MKHTKGIWVSTFSAGGKRGVRAKGGFICFLPKVTRYQDQDARYEEELEEDKANAQLIAASPDQQAASILLYNLCKKLALNLSYSSFDSVREQWNEAMSAHEQAINKATE